MSHRGREDAGQAAVELVLVLPLLLLVALAALQVALVARDQLLVVHAAREGARAAAVGAGDSEVARAAAAATALDRPALSVRAERDVASGTAQVRATYTAPTDVPLVGGVIGSVRLRATVVMHLEQR